jgi:hypothetical protein
VRNPTRVVEMWSTRDATLVRQLPFEGEQPLRANCATLSSDERELIAMTEAGELMSLSLENGQTRRVPLIAKGPERCTVMAASGHVLVVTANEVIKASLPGLNNVKRVGFRGSSMGSAAPSISANGAYVACLRENDQLDVVDVASMKMIQPALTDLTCSSDPSFDPTSRYLGFGASVYRVGTWKSLVRYEKPEGHRD